MAENLQTSWFCESTAELCQISLFDHFLLFETLFKLTSFGIWQCYLKKKRRKDESSNCSEIKSESALPCWVNTSVGIITEMQSQSWRLVPCWLSRMLTILSRGMQPSTCKLLALFVVLLVGVADLLSEVIEAGVGWRSTGSSADCIRCSPVPWLVAYVSGSRGLDDNISTPLLVNLECKPAEWPPSKYDTANINKQDLSLKSIYLTNVYKFNVTSIVYKWLFIWSRRSPLRS